MEFYELLGEDEEEEEQIEQKQYKINIYPQNAINMLIN